MPFFDAKLVFDPETRSCDVRIGDDGDLDIDETPVTPMLISIGSDARAAIDDPLPAGQEWTNVDPGENLRRGWPCDALDPRGRRRGSKLWLLDRAFKTEETRLFAETALKTSLAWAEAETGRPAEISVFWLPDQRGGNTVGRLGYTAFIADREPDGARGTVSGSIALGDTSGVA